MAHFGPETKNPGLRAIRAVLDYSTKVDEIQELNAQVQALEAALPLWNAQEESK